MEKRKRHPDFIYLGAYINKVYKVDLLFDNLGHVDFGDFTVTIDFCFHLVTAEFFFRSVAAVDALINGEVDSVGVNTISGFCLFYLEVVIDGEGHTVDVGLEELVHEIDDITLGGLMLAEEIIKDGADAGGDALFIFLTQRGEVLLEDGADKLFVICIYLHGAHLVKHLFSFVVM